MHVASYVLMYSIIVTNYASHIYVNVSITVAHCFTLSPWYLFHRQLAIATQNSTLDDNIKLVGLLAIAY